MKYLQCLLLILPALLTGCDESLGPLDTPQRGVIDARLLGRWIYSPGEEQRKDCSACYSELEVSAFNEHEYYVEMRGYKAYEPASVDHYRVFSSSLGGRTFVNIQSLKSGEPRRYILGAYEFQTSGDVLVFSLARNLPEQVKGSTNSKIISRYVREHKDEKDFFDPPMRFNRHKASPPSSP